MGLTSSKPPRRPSFLRQLTGREAAWPDGGCRRTDDRLEGSSVGISSPRPVHLFQRLLAWPSSPERDGRPPQVRRRLGPAGHSGLVLGLAPPPRAIPQQGR